jgi:hypothetical protein
VQCRRHVEREGSAGLGQAWRCCPAGFLQRRAAVAGGRTGGQAVAPSSASSCRPCRVRRPPTRGPPADLFSRLTQCDSPPSLLRHVCPVNRLRAGVRFCAPVRRHRRGPRGWLWPSVGWIGFHAGAPCSRMNNCHHRPVNSALPSQRGDRPQSRPRRQSPSRLDATPLTRKCGLLPISKLSRLVSRPIRTARDGPGVG